MDDIQIGRILSMSTPGELRLPVDERAAVEGREEPLVRVEDERVGLLDPDVLVAQ
jgi:hypothetical protein